MTDFGFSTKTFEFLANLEVNNNRDWWLQHKQDFESNVRLPFLRLIDGLSAAMETEGIGLSGGSKTIFRMNRDTRFSHDKSPYKTFTSGLLTSSGTKDISGGVVYLHLDSKGGFMVAGLYQPPTERLFELRQRMVESHDKFQALIDNLGSTGLHFDPTDATKTMPRGFADFSNHQHAESIKLKSLIVRQNFVPQDWESSEFEARVLDFIQRSKPLIDFVS